MACDNRTKVYLGYEDEYVADKHRSLLNFTTNKIGGHPVSKGQKAHLPSRESFSLSRFLIFLFRSTCSSLDIQQNVSDLTKRDVYNNET